MKKILLALLFIIVFAGFYTNQLINDQVKTLLKTLKLSEDYINQTIFSDFSYPSFYFPGVSELKSIALNDRAAQVEVIGKYVKEFTASADFKSQYDKYRETKKPSPPEKPKTIEEIKKEDKENLTKSVEDLKKTQASAPADQKVYYDESIKALEEQLKSMDDPNNPSYSTDMNTYIQQGYQMQLDQYNQELAEWEKKYPANNTSTMIKNCLKEFLDGTKDIDFSAKTKAGGYGNTVFVNQDYERKSNLWKLGYRAGKETTEAARKFAQSWLNEIK